MAEPGRPGAPPDEPGGPRAGRRVLDLGCGRNKRPGAVGLDRDPRSGADVRGDLNARGLPFRDGVFDEAQLAHVIEHVQDVVALMAEVHRVCKPGARVTVRTPHFSSIHAYTDPGHRQRLARGSMDQVRKDLAPDRPIEVLRKEILFHAGWWAWPARLIYWLSPHKYEQFFAFAFPARELAFELRILERPEGQA
jgi:SAM-dependent methyltransferase